MKHTVVLIPGDGIGPEVADATRRVFEAAKAPIEWIERYAGSAAVERGFDNVLPLATIEAIKETKTALKGPCTTPIGGGFGSVNVALRKNLNLYGAVRPVRTMEGIKTRYDNVDIVVVRENTEGLYAGVENVITDGVVTSLKVVTRDACKRIARFAFEFAVKHRRKKITVLHKANIMKLGDGLFLRCAQEIHEKDFPGVAYEEMIIDAACMKLVQDPSRFDVILTENLYGDIVSDLCAGLVGGLGCTPGANYGQGIAVFEAVHGSAPDIAGMNLANPLALITSGVVMLRHLAETRADPECNAAADRIRKGYSECMVAGEKTRDLGGSLGTREFADALIRRIG